MQLPLFTPYNGGMLLAAAAMSGGWGGDAGSHWPADWGVRVEGFVPLL